MPRKIRALESDLARAGFTRQSAKGSHRKWTHPRVKRPVTVSGSPGANAQTYQEIDVRDAIRESKRPYKERNRMEGHDMHYSLVIQWEPEGQVYVVSVPELPGCKTHGVTYEEAVTQAKEAIDTWVMDVDPATWPQPAIYDLGDLHTNPLTEADIQASAEATRQSTKA